MSVTVGPVANVPNEYFTAQAYSMLNQMRESSLRHTPQRFAEALFKRGVETVDGGWMFTVPWEMENHSVPTRVTQATAYGQFNKWAQPTMTSGGDTQGYIVQPVFISHFDKVVNRGKGEQVNIVKRRVKNVYDHLLRQAQQAFLVGVPASGSHPGVVEWDDFNDLNGTDRATGFIEEDSSGGNTIHGVSRATYPATTHPGLHNIAIDCQNAAGTYLLDGAVNARGLMDIRGISMEAGFEWFCTNAFQQNVAKTLRNGLQYTTMKGGDEQMAAPQFLGKPLTVVPELPYRGASSATYKWSCVGVTFGRGVRFRGQSGHVLDMDPFETYPGTVKVQSALFHLFGQLVTPDPSLQILFHRAEAYS